MPLNVYLFCIAAPIGAVRGWSYRRPAARVMRHRVPCRPALRRCAAAGRSGGSGALKGKRHQTKLPTAMGGCRRRSPSADELVEDGGAFGERFVALAVLAVPFARWLVGDLGGDEDADHPICLVAGG